MEFLLFSVASNWCIFTPFDNQQSDNKKGLKSQRKNTTKWINCTKIHQETTLNLNTNWNNSPFIIWPRWELLSSPIALFLYEGEIIIWDNAPIKQSSCLGHRVIVVNCVTKTMMGQRGSFEVAILGHTVSWGNRRNLPKGSSNVVTSRNYHTKSMAGVRLSNPGIFWGNCINI